MYLHGNTGIPDRLVVLPGGRIEFVEMKRPGGTTTKLQDKQIEFLRKLGFKVHIIDSIIGVNEFIEEVQKSGKANI